MKIKAILLCLPVMILAACSSDDSSSSSTSTLASSVTTVNNKLNDAASVIDSASFTSSMASVSPLSAGLDTVWTTGTVSDLYTSGNYTLKEWFIDEFNPAFVNDNGAKVTAVGRIANSLDILCFLGELGFTTDSSGLPAVGVYTGTLTSAMATTCGDASAANTDITLTVTATSDTTLYDKSFSADMGNACPFKFMLRVNSTAINIATSEDQSCDSRDYGSAAVVLYDVTNNKMRFTYHSQGFSGGSGGFEFYRGYYDGGADTSYMLGIYGGDDFTAGDAGMTSHVAYTVVGKPSAGGDIAVSAKIKGLGIADGVYNGCIDAATQAVTSSTDTLTCDMTGEDIATSYTNTIIPARAANSAISDIYNIGDTTTVGFTDNTDMF